MNKHFLLRAIVSGCITLIVLALTSALGVWQYSQSQRDDIRNEVLSAKPVMLSEIHAPEEFVQENVFARKVKLEGMLDCENSLALSSRTIQGDVCLFESENTLPIAIFLNEAVPIETTNSVTLIGRLQPSQSYEPVSFSRDTSDVISEINIHQLVDHYQQNLFDGFVFAQSLQSGDQRQKLSIEQAELILPPAGIEFRNLFYAWQWWIFAGFAVLLWVKYVRDEWRKHESTL